MRCVTETLAGDGTAAPRRTCARHRCMCRLVCCHTLSWWQRLLDRLQLPEQLPPRFPYRHRIECAHLHQILHRFPGEQCVVPKLSETSVRSRDNRVLTRGARCWSKRTHICEPQSHTECTGCGMCIGRRGHT